MSNLMGALFGGGAPVVNVIKLSGTISPNMGSPGGRYIINMERVSRAIDRAFKGYNLKAVALDINCGGGSPVQAQLIYNHLLRKRKESGLPVYAFVEDMALSGGYFLACAADKIIADKSSMVGSIGVIAASFGFHETIKKLGIERRVHARGDNKDMLDSFQPLKSKDKAIIDEVLNDLYKNFKDIVVAARFSKAANKLNLSTAEEVEAKYPELFSGRLWAAERGKDLGLVDELGDRIGFCRQMFGDKVRFRNCNYPFGSMFDFGGYSAALHQDSFLSSLPVELQQLYAMHMQAERNPNNNKFSF